MEIVAATELLAALAPPTAVSWFAYLVIGAIAGWVAGKIVKGGGSGILMNILVGVVGGFIGGGLLHWLGVDVGGGRLWFTFFVAVLGSVILLWIVGMVQNKKV